MSSKTKKIVKWLIIGSVLTVFTLITALALFVVMFLKGGPVQTSDDYKDYKVIYDLLYEHRTGMLAFPETLSEDIKDIDFSYSYQDTWDDPTAYIFMQATYSPEAYRKEVNRLENTRKVYGATECRLLRDEEGKYAYPAYIAIENYSYAYEYALLTGENQITYIFTSFYDREDIPFDSKYLPTDFMTDEGRAFGSGDNIYISHRGSDYLELDYTRSENVEVSYCYSGMYENNYFMVRVRLDDENREIIEQCEYYEYATLDSKAFMKEDVEPKTTIWTDLQGCEFVDKEIDFANDCAIVTYLDGGEEKEWRVDL